MHICVFAVCQSVSLCCIVRSQTQTTCRFFVKFEIKLYHASDFLEMFLRYQLSAAANLTQVMVFGSIFWVWLKCIYLRPVSYFNFRMVGQSVGQHFQERSADVNTRHMSHMSDIPKAAVGLWPVYPSARRAVWPWHIFVTSRHGAAFRGGLRTFVWSSERVKQQSYSELHKSC